MTFEEYVIARGPALVRLARLLANDHHRADDLVQEILAKAFTRWRRIARADDPDAYVRRMLINGHRSWYRRRSNREVVVADFPDRAGAHDLGSVAVERDAMWRSITALPPRQRVIVVLRYYEDMDDAEIARLLDCSPVTVRVHAMRALAALRERHVAMSPAQSRRTP